MCERCGGLMYKMWCPYPVGDALSCINCGAVIFRTQGVPKQSGPPVRSKFNLPLCKCGCGQLVKRHRGAVKYASLKCWANDTAEARFMRMKTARKVKVKKRKDAAIKALEKAGINPPISGHDGAVFRSEKAEGINTHPTPKDWNRTRCNLIPISSHKRGMSHIINGGTQHE